MRMWIIALGALAMASPAFAEAADAPFAATTLELSAAGRTEAAPDVATLQIGVHADGASASAALAGQRARMASIMATLRAQGVAERDIQTAQLNLSPQYDDDGKSARRLTGYQASNGVAVRVRDITRVGPVVDALVAAGANEIDGVGFGLSDPGAAEDQARRDAFRALQAKADLYAAVSGYHIRRLVRLSEGGGYAPPQPMAAAMVMARRRTATPIAAGALTVEVDVSGVYELTR